MMDLSQTPTRSIDSIHLVNNSFSTELAELIKAKLHKRIRSKLSRRKLRIVVDEKEFKCGNPDLLKRGIRSAFLRQN